MAKLMGNLNLVLGLGAVLLLIVIFGLHGDALDGNYANWVFRYLHVLFGILWIGLLYYFNFVQIPTMPKIPAELKPGISKYIAPEALFRSEEHTSELQSLMRISYAVFCLTKKNTRI